MIPSDYHVHTARCGHAGGETREYVLSALSRGLLEVAITDHIPLYFLGGDDPEPEFAMAAAELPGYVEEVLSLREEFAGRIDVLLGIEADYAEGREEDLSGILSKYPWDVVLGSVHWVAGDWIDGPASARRHEAEGSGPLWGEYYRLLASAARSGLFDVMTHFDLPKKFGHRRPAACAAAESAAVEAVAQAGIAVEVSSAGLRKTIGEIYPGPALLRSLGSAGVPVVFASDAHAPAEVAWQQEALRTAAQAAGYTHHLTYRNRTPAPHPL